MFREGKRTWPYRLMWRLTKPIFPWLPRNPSQPCTAASTRTELASELTNSIFFHDFDLEASGANRLAWSVLAPKVGFEAAICHHLSLTPNRVTSELPVVGTNLDGRNFLARQSPRTLDMVTGLNSNCLDR